MNLTSFPSPGYHFVAQEIAVNIGKYYTDDNRRIMLFPRLDKIMLELYDKNISSDSILPSLMKKTNISFEIAIRKDELLFLSLPEKIDSLEMERLLNVLAKMEIIAKVGYVYINEETAKESCLTGKAIIRLKDIGYKQRILQYADEHDLSFIRLMHGTDNEMVFEYNHSFTDPVLGICRDLENLDYVEWAAPDFLFQLDLHHIPNDPLFNQQWHLENTGQTGAIRDADVDAEFAWDNPQIAAGGSSDIVIAIIDTGVEVDHPDLEIYINQLEYDGTQGVDDDGNGYVDDIHGWDFYNNDGDPNPGFTTDTASVAHGTCCAGVAGAIGNNGIGVAGAAFNARILPIKITSDKGIFTSSYNISWGIRYAADMAHVLSNSWGGSGGSSIHSAIQYAVDTKNKSVFFSSGNDADGIDSDPCWIHYHLDFSSDLGNRYFQWTYHKDGATTAGEDCAWIDDVAFPDGSTEDFEDDFAFGDWATGGDDVWTFYTESRHVRGAGVRSMRSGNIGHNQETWIRSPQVNITRGSALYFWLWVDCRPIMIMSD
ncbi:S8 family serine peptidase [Candidatus Sumerlaeota bacterium]|nr:S8 family serine peptidase [Candidatus Sumerlaeota bacterium]